MHPVVNQLVQLQELIQIRDEQKVARGGAHLEELNVSIRGMTARLPNDTRGHFEKLLKRGPSAVVPVSVSVCSGCGITLPTSLVQQVRQAHDVKVCPNCARFLFCTPEAPRRLGAKRRRTGTQKGGIARFSAATLMIPELASDTPEGAIRELAGKLEAEGFIQGVEPMVEAALQREATVSTALSHGIAVPHVRGVEGGGLTLAMGLSHKGIRWDAHATELTRIVVFIIIPTVASAFYLKLLAGLAETFTQADARKLILETGEAEAMWKTLVKITRSTVK